MRLRKMVVVAIDDNAVVRAVIDDNDSGDW